MHIEHQPVNYKLCFLSEEKLFRLIVDLIKTILAAFISRFVRHPEKTKLNSESTMYSSPDSSNFFEILHTLASNNFITTGYREFLFNLIMSFKI